MHKNELRTLIMILVCWLALPATAYIGINKLAENPRTRPESVNPTITGTLDAESLVESAPDYIDGTPKIRAELESLGYTVIIAWESTSGDTGAWVCLDSVFAEVTPIREHYQITFSDQKCE